MARPYSLDLRERVVAQVAGGMSCHEAAELNNVVPSTVVKWTQRQRQTGSPAAKPMGGKRPVLLAGQRAFILKRIAVRPDTSIRALRAELAEAGILVSYGAVWTFLHREGLSCKKKPARERARPNRRRPAARPLEKLSAAD